jgi:hypothetical protein
LIQDYEPECERIESGGGQVDRARLLTPAKVS